jgi:CheY-like chemotaxis protein
MTEKAGFPDSATALREFHHPDTGRNTALIVDDCPSMRAFARIVISKALPELEIIVAEHPIAAIAHLSKKDVAASLAFMWFDKDMPEMSGIELAQAIDGEVVNGVSLHPDRVDSMRGVPRLMMTAAYDPLHAQELIDDGLFHHVGEKGGQGGIKKVFEHVYAAIERASLQKAEGNTSFPSVT